MDFKNLGPVGNFWSLRIDNSALHDLVLPLREQGITARLVRGGKMKDAEGVFDEFASALQFPLYFGENWAAFNECIADLDWMIAGGDHFVLVINDAENVLTEATQEEFSYFVQSLLSAQREFSEPIALGEWWDRPPIPFHVMVNSKAGGEADFNRWVKAGVNLRSLTLET